MDDLSLKEQQDLANAKSGGWRKRTKEEMALILRSTPKCVNHPKVSATKAARARGLLLCTWCDPESVAQRLQDKKNKERGRGKRKLHIPASIAEFYETATLDDNLIELREDVAVTEARIQQILKQIKDSPYESTSFIKFFQKNFDQQLSLCRKGMLSYPEFISSMQAVLNGKISEIMQYQEFYKVTDLKRKLVETETKRMKDLGWTPDYAYSVVLAMTKALKQVVPTTKVLEFQKILAEDPVFQNGAFRILPSVDIIKKTEVEIKNETKENNVVTTTQDTQGTYVSVTEEEDPIPHNNGNGVLGSDTGQTGTI